MKKLFLLLVITIGFSLSAQTENYAGTYILHLEGKDGNFLDYKLQLIRIIPLCLLVFNSF